jgi:DNA-binding beta-propeller fold protein YncE
MLSNKRVVTYLGCALFSILPFTKVSATENYKFAIVDRFTLGGEGRWDYLTYDVKQQRLFISRSSHVQVVDANSGKVIGDIPNTSGVHGIAIANDVNRGFTSNGKEDSVTVFDLITLKAIETIKLSGKDPDDIIYDPLSKRIFAFNGHSANVSVIDAQSLKESNVIALAGTPETAVLDGKGKIFVNIEDKNTIAVIDIAKNKVIKSFKLGDGNGPTGLAIDTKHQ